MSLRDWFAGQIIGSPLQASRFQVTGLGAVKSEMLAHHAYEIADAMLAEREK
jgi:hypothetical protein